MSVTFRVAARLNALVHPSATVASLSRRQHEAFMAQKLAVAFAVLAFAPFYLAFHGAPDAADTLLFCFGLLPLCAATVVAQSGRLATGHAVAYGGLVGVCLTLLLGKGVGAGCASTWLVVAQLELVMSLDRRLNRLGGLATGAVLCVIIMMALRPDAATVSRFAAPAAGLAVAYAVLSAQIVVELIGLTRRREKEQGDRWDAVADAIGDLVLGFDGRGGVATVSTQCEAMLGVEAGDLLGVGLFDRIHVADRPAFLKLVGDASHGDETMTATLRLRTGQADLNPAGFVEPRHIWIEARARKLTGSDRQLPEVVAILRDVTAAHQHELEMEAARASIEKAIRARDHFLANMSHELRTPLNAIIGFSEMLSSRTMRPAEQDKQREYAGIILQSGQHLLSVVNSILDMSKIQSGTFAIIPEPFDLLPLVEQCCDMIRLKAMQVSITIVQDCPDELEELIGDRRACKQVLLNLLSNAVKFTPDAGMVTIRVRPEGTALAITVSDTGIGIRAEDLDRLGDSFFQARSSLSRPYEGTGLGLSVVRGLVGLHGGSIRVESAPDKGTSVTVRLPLDCRAVMDRATPATIETFARDSSPEHTRPHVTRMKTSA